MILIILSAEELIAILAP